MSKFRKQLEDYMMSGYPAMWVQTSEYERVIPDLKGVASRVKCAIFEWNVLDGMTQDGKILNEETRDPLEALKCIRSKHYPEKSIFVFKDFHHFLHQPEMMEATRQLVEICKATNRFLVFLAPIGDIQMELKNLIVLLEHPLPTVDELEKIITTDVFVEAREYTLEAKKKKDDWNEIVRSFSGMTGFEAEQVAALSYSTKECYDKDVIYSQKKQILAKSQVLEFVENRELPSVGGYDNIKKFLSTRRKATTQKAREYGLPMPKGILAAGPPGVGKSLLAKVIAKEWEMPLLRLDMGRVFSGLVGSSEANIRSAMKIADAMEPCILWVDEIEKGLAGISSSGSTDSGVTARVAGTFLTWMQEHQSAVFVFATANDVSKMPPETLRKGRFDELFWLDLPNEDEREEIWKIHIGRVKRDVKKFDLKDLVGKSIDFTGAEIEYALYAAMYTAFSRDEEVTDFHIMKSCMETVPISRQMTESIQKGRDWAATRAVKATSDKKGEMKAARKSL